MPFFDSNSTVHTSCDTPTYTQDDQQWLTYWAVFNAFNLTISLVKDIAVYIPGFFSVMILTVAFLLLPMTRGAETIFRKVLVPICGMEACVKREPVLSLVPFVVRVHGDDL